MAAPDTIDEILDVNRRYHDVAAADYDTKWGVDFGEVGRTQVLGKVEKLLGRSPGPFARSLEIGAGTGYFSLNLLQAGVVRSAVCTDVSSGMLATLRGNAERLGLDVEIAQCDAAALPFEDAAFDLVLGHAVLHHLPELDRRSRSSRACCGPAGRSCSPASRRTRRPDRRGAEARGARGRAALAADGRARPAARERERRRRRAGRPCARGGRRRARVHAGDLSGMPRAPASRDVRVRGEELLANWFGWFNRTSRRPRHDDIPRPGSSTPTAATSRCKGRPRAPRSRAYPAAGLLQPDADRAQAAGLRPPARYVFRPAAAIHRQA